MLKHFITVRPAINEVKELFNKTPIVGCEIGTYRGIHAEQILKALPYMKKLYLVDPYERYNNYTDFDKMGAFNPTFFTDAQMEAKKRLKKYEHKIEWVQSRFSADLIDEQLDFIYIDGNHEYYNVIHDIKESEKLVNHGVIGGHDYYPENHHLESKFGVGRAVREYYYEYGFEWKYNDWWIYQHQIFKTLK